MNYLMETIDWKDIELKNATKRDMLSDYPAKSLGTNEFSKVL